MTAKAVNDRLDEVYQGLDRDDLFDGAAGKDTTSVGHMILDEERRLLHYMRLIEHEMPKLVGACCSAPQYVRKVISLPDCL